MKGSDLLRIVDQMHHEKNIDREIIFSGIEAALQLATQKKFGEETQVTVTIDRDSGEIHALKGEEVIDPTELGRIAAQSAKQVMIQKIREAECNAVFDEYQALKGDLVHGTVQRFEGGAATVTLGKSEAILPRGEQIPGETHHVGERIKAVILDVRKVGHRVKIILSRTHPDFVRRLFENEIPEIADRTIEIKAVAREAGYRTKVAVSSIDLKVDCVGACVGVRGSRIKNIVEELGGEKIDIVRWNESSQILIGNSLKPAEVVEVALCFELGRATVLVNDDQLSLAIGKRGLNVRLAAELIGAKIDIKSEEEVKGEVADALSAMLQEAMAESRSQVNVHDIDEMPGEWADTLEAAGYDDLDSVVNATSEDLSAIDGVDEEMAAQMIELARKHEQIEEQGSEETPEEEEAGEQAQEEAQVE